MSNTHTITPQQVEARVPRGIQGNDMDVVFMYYDEPGAYERLERFKAVRSNIRVVSGVKGINQCHAAACDLAGTEFFVLIDGDNSLHPNSLRSGPLQPDFEFQEPPPHVDIVGYMAHNRVNGILSSHGGLKVVRKSAKSWFQGLDVVDYCMTPNWQTAPQGSPYTFEHTNLTAFHAFRTAYKEVSRMLRNPRKPDTYLTDWFEIRHRTGAKRNLWHWAVLGADVEFGVDSMGGAAMALANWANSVYADEALPEPDWFFFADTLGEFYDAWASVASLEVATRYLHRFCGLVGEQWTPLSEPASAQVRAMLCNLEA